VSGARPIRVLHVMEAMVRGGAESLIVEHARCAGPGVEVFLCALNREGPALEAAARAGASIVRLPHGGGPLRPITRVRALARAMRAARIDVVNGHNPTGGLYATVAGRLAGVAVIVRTEHSLHYAGRHSGLYPLIERILTLMTRRVVCVCRAVLDSHARRLPWAARRFVTVANGISPAPRTRPRQEVRADLGIEPAAALLLSVGSLTKQKAQHVLIDAFAVVHAARPGARLAIAGDGPLRGALETQARRLGLDGLVIFLGGREDVADLVEACDLFVLSSEREGLPVTLLEAMRGGRAAVVTRVGGMPEAVEDGITGRIVPAGDTAAMAAMLLALLEDAGARTAMGAAAAVRWRAAFTAERMVAETEAIYREALGAPARAPAEAEREAHHAAR
jgi:glycosyltransferase involved in cell wall biosynthesis